MYLEEEWALVLGLRAGRPEPVGQWSSLGCGDKVAQSHRLLQDVQSLLMGLHTICTLALRDNTDEINERSKTCFLQTWVLGVIFILLWCQVQINWLGFCNQFLFYWWVTITLRTTTVWVTPWVQGKYSIHFSFTQEQLCLYLSTSAVFMQINNFQSHVWNFRLRLQAKFDSVLFCLTWGSLGQYNSLRLNCTFWPVWG